MDNVKVCVWSVCVCVSLQDHIIPIILRLFDSVTVLQRDRRDTLPERLGKGFVYLCACKKNDKPMATN